MLDVYREIGILGSGTMIGQVQAPVYASSVDFRVSPTRPRAAQMEVLVADYAVSAKSGSNVAFNPG
jgi:hypothetical protein